MSLPALVLAAITILAAAPPQKAAAPSKAGSAARGPRQEAIEWFLSSAEDAPAHLVASGRDQITALAQAKTDPPELGKVIVAMVGPAAMFRAQDAKVTGPASNAVTIENGSSPPLQVTFEPEAISGDHALVPLAIRSGTMTARGSIELTRENGAWKIAAADLGPQARYPRFDSPSFVPEMVTMVNTSLRQNRIAGNAASAKGLLRATISAEETFQSVNGGFAGPLECLTAPASCLPPSASSQPFLSSASAPAGYTARFIAGPGPTAAEISRAHASRRSIKSWAFVLEPASSDIPGFCADSTGKVCQLAATEKAVSGPACPASCEIVK